MFTGDHSAPHFHAGSSDEWEVRVYFLQEPVVLEEKWSVKRIPGRVLRELLNLATNHRSELLAQWERSVADD
jgi:hypothetical protein